MAYSIFLTNDAALDLQELCNYIQTVDLKEKADRVLDRLQEVINSLAEQPEQPEQPERGAYPNELSALGIREYREVYFKPYRVIYRVNGQKVFVLLIVDGRRDMQRLLQRRLLAG
ncbi:type II toxin-antitoxin system RelE/ParE family toxin [Microbulbifer sp. CAU 1566]|uniref:type II toxin-antitoxin system RelE/ParE family toxin n=1 Tax=Microbulbifer sp. CAU 1566 TaxID=2933269 RepID=UPI0020055F46|nr:type II toxin-antitoxin system RelE/ParE family toxin [Microbulbifer sp. CAU 1566]MCK7598416.1 type II toxin-antitoxin system RelE/ParE family toxin [Microbulbifer sp. CAU 1566]